MTDATCCNAVELEYIDCSQFPLSRERLWEVTGTLLWQNMYGSAEMTSKRFWHVRWRWKISTLSSLQCNFFHPLKTWTALTFKITGSPQPDDVACIIHSTFLFITHISDSSPSTTACCAFIWLFDSLLGCLPLCHCPRAAAAFPAETSSTCSGAAETNLHSCVLQSGWRPRQPLRPRPHTQTWAAARATGLAVPPGKVVLILLTFGLWTEIRSYNYGFRSLKLICVHFNGTSHSCDIPFKPSALLQTVKHCVTWYN